MNEIILTVTTYMHIISSLIWWSLTFLVVVIINPINKNGIYSNIFSRIQKNVMIFSTSSIIFGLILLLINTDFSPIKLFYSIWGNLIIIGGTIAIFVYINILIRSIKKNTTKSLSLKLKSSLNVPKYRNQIRVFPLLMFTSLTISLLLMIYASHSLTYIK